MHDGHPADVTQRFDAVVAAVVALLRCEGRVTYRRLRLACGIDDSFLQAVTEELVFKRVARDEGGSGLVWLGEPLPITRELALPVASIEPPPVSYGLGPSPDAAIGLDDVTPARGEMPREGALTAARAVADPAGERRQLTVMFCDLVDFTRLASQLDPEDLRDLVRAYQATAAEVIQRFEGHIAQYLGDGLVVYFGFPIAHEDDAARAIHSSLKILDALAALNARPEVPLDAKLAVRLGIHTGPVVVDRIGEAGRHEQLALGDTPNIAARLQTLAVPNTIVISSATARLVRDGFTLEDLGLQQLKGVAQAFAVFRVVGAIDPPPLGEEGRALPVPPLVGRDEELGLLVRRWQQSKERLGQVVLLSGDAGIGKTSLVRALRTRVQKDGAPSIVFRCSAYHRNSALYPVITHVERVLGLGRDEPSGIKLAKLEAGLQGHRLPTEEVVPLFAALLSIPLDDRYSTPALSPNQQKQQTLDALMAWLLDEADQQPVLVGWEDLHWADPSTLEFLGTVLEQAPTVAMLHVLTFRPEFTPPWRARTHITPVTLNRLERSHVEALVASIADHMALPAEVLQYIVSKTDGVPLYVEELTKMLLESSVLQRDGEAYILAGPLLTVAIPGSLQDSLSARLDHLGRAKEIAQAGAVLGREFTYDMLRAVLPENEAALQAGLEELVRAELLYQRGRPPRARYLFKHALIQDAAYSTLVRATRQHYHQRVAQWLETNDREIAANQPELVANHYTEAGCLEQAIEWWHRAGRRAAGRSAYLESIAHIRKGLHLLGGLPQTSSRDEHELMLQLSVGPPLLMTQGPNAHEVELTYRRARQLSEQVGDRVQLARVSFALWGMYTLQARHTDAMTLGEELLAVAGQTDHPMTHLVAENAIGSTLWWLGAFEGARDHLHEALRLEARAPGGAIRDAGFARVATQCYAAFALWVLGYPEQARQRVDAALALAYQLPHLYSRAFAHHYAATAYVWLGEPEKVLGQAEAELALATEHGFPLWLAGGRINRATALLSLGQHDAGIPELECGIAAWRATGSDVAVPMYLCWLAGGYCRAGRTGEAMSRIRQGLTLLQRTGERSYEAELHRIQGELLLQQANPARAELSLELALRVARDQHSRSWELRAAIGLARMWQEQGRSADAYGLLAPIFGAFSEGFEGADLREAKGLLGSLAGVQS